MQATAAVDAAGDDKNTVPQSAECTPIGRESTAAENVDSRSSKKIKKKKKKMNDPIMKSELQDAIDVLEKKCKTVPFKIHPTMIPAMAPLTMTETSGGVKEIQYNNVDCNHNTPSLSKGYQIMNNVLKNPMNIKNEYEQTLGTDQQLFALDWNKVRQCLTTQ